MARTTVELELVALVEKASASINKFADQTNKQLSGISMKTTISALNDGFELVGKTAGRVAQTIQQVFEHAIDEASAAEQASFKLANALRISGDFSEDAVSSFDRLAKSIQRTTTFSDEQVLSSVAIAKQYQLTNKEAEKAIAVASDLAARTGTDLETAMQKVSRTFQGFVDKDLARSIPGLKALSKESLVAGEALDKIGRAVQGSAAALGNTFDGALTRTQNALSDVFETLGNAVVKNPAVIAGINAIQSALVELNDSFEKNGETLKDLVTKGFLLLVQAVPSVVRVFKFIDEVISSNIVLVNVLGKAIGALGAALAALAEGNFSGIADIKDAFSKEASDAILDNARRIDGFYTPLLKTTEKLAKNIENVTKKAKDSSKELKQGPSQTGQQARTLNLLTPEEIKRQLDAQKKLIEDASKDPVKQIIDVAFGKITFDSKQAVAAGAGLLNTALKGADGASKIVTSALGAAADAILPGIGGVVSEIAGELAKGPEHVKNMVQSFVKSLPEVIKNIVLAIPALIDALIQGIPDFINAMVNALPEIVESLAKSMPFVGLKLALEMPKIAISFSQSLIRNIPEIIKGFIDGLIDAAGEFVDALIEAIPGGKVLTGSVKPFSSGGGSAVGRGVADVLTGGLNEITGNAIGNFIDDLWPFDSGGRLGNIGPDGMPIKVHSREQILGEDLSDKLAAFLDGQDAGRPLTVNIRVGENELANVLLNLNRRGFRTA